MNSERLCGHHRKLTAVAFRTRTILSRKRESPDYAVPLKHPSVSISVHPWFNSETAFNRESTPINTNKTEVFPPHPIRVRFYSCPFVVFRVRALTFRAVR